MADTLGHSSDDTLISSGPRARPPATERGATRRPTVLPRVEWDGSQPNVVPLQRERFEELGRLGQGGMGEVVLLKDHDIERTVALKRLSAESGPDLVSRFVEEIRTVGQLDHPNIVPVHDVGVDDLGRYYFVMKHLEGETLESIITRLRQGDGEAHARFTFPVRIQIFRGILNALAYAHRKGIIHRDLKPSNIMVGPFGEVTVMDWGLARRTRAPAGGAPGASAPGAGTVGPREVIPLRTQVGAIMGTPLYMSPEQARGQHDALDERSDIYSLFVVLYELLYLRHYLEGRESLADILEGVQTVKAQVHGPPTSPHQPPVPAELTWFLARGLEKDPAKRYPSIDAVLEELKNVQEGHIQVHCQRTLVKRGLHELLGMVDRHPTAVIIGSTLMACLVLMSAVQFVLMLLHQ